MHSIILRRYGVFCALQPSGRIVRAVRAISDCWIGEGAVRSRAIRASPWAISPGERTRLTHPLAIALTCKTRCDGMLNTRLGWMSSRSVINSTGIAVKRGRISWSLVATVRRWLTMTMAMPRSDGRFRSNRISASRPPAESPTQTTGKSLTAPLAFMGGISGVRGFIFMASPVSAGVQRLALPG